jgi:hypothetical protein
MRPAFALLLLCACGGPTQQQILETPAANQFENLAEAPPASQSDEDRYRLIQQFDDMQVTQRAYEEAREENRMSAEEPLDSPSPLPKRQTPPKKGVAEQAPLPP